MKLIELWWNCKNRHNPTAKELDGMAEKIASEEWFGKMNNMPMEVLCQNPDINTKDLFGMVLQSVRTPKRGVGKSPDGTSSETSGRTEAEIELEALQGRFRSKKGARLAKPPKRAPRAKPDQPEQTSAGPPNPKPTASQQLSFEAHPTEPVG